MIKIDKSKLLPLFCFILTIAAVIMAAYFSYPPLEQDSFEAADDTMFISYALEEDKVNVNTAPLDELMVLKGIGEVKAQAIIDIRNEKGPFEKAEDLLEVKGIGEKTLEEIRPFICFR